MSGLIFDKTHWRWVTKQNMPKLLDRMFIVFKLELFFLNEQVLETKWTSCLSLVAWHFSTPILSFAWIWHCKLFFCFNSGMIKVLLLMMWCDNYPKLGFENTSVIFLCGVSSSMVFFISHGVEDDLVFAAGRERFGRKAKSAKKMAILFTCFILSYTF